MGVYVCVCVCVCVYVCVCVTWVTWVTCVLTTDAFGYSHATRLQTLQAELTQHSQETLADKTYVDLLKEVCDVDPFIHRHSTAPSNHSSFSLFTQEPRR